MFKDDFIGVYDGVLSLDECQRLINLFENEDSSRKRVTSETIRYNAADKRALTLAVDVNNPKDAKYHTFLEKAINKSLVHYRNKYYDSLMDQEYWDIHPQYNFQKYSDGEGYYSLHHEHGYHAPYRMLVWMLYLNNSPSGTEFPYQKKVLKAKSGRMVFWPASWTHLHKGVTPNEGIKYIMTGWFTYCINN
tara:strand:- start:36 stop:608 length:573 start_codon:yes stop_codon:yes gene_type:complete